VSLSKVKLTGGPHGKDTKLEVDGEEVHGVHRVVLVADINDAIRITTYQIVTAAVEASGVWEDGGFTAIVKVPVYSPKRALDDPSRTIQVLDRELSRTYEANGPTRKEALLNAVHQMPE
jgi:hypothetical protein